MEVQQPCINACGLLTSEKQAALRDTVCREGLKEDDETLKTLNGHLQLVDFRELTQIWLEVLKAAGHYLIPLLLISPCAAFTTYTVFYFPKDYLFDFMLITWWWLPGVIQIFFFAFCTQGSAKARQGYCRSSPPSWLTFVWTTMMETFLCDESTCSYTRSKNSIKTTDCNSVTYLFSLTAMKFAGLGFFDDNHQVVQSVSGLLAMERNNSTRTGHSHTSPTKGQPPLTYQEYFYLCKPKALRWKVSAWIAMNAKSFFELQPAIELIEWFNGRCGECTKLSKLVSCLFYLTHK